MASARNKLDGSDWCYNFCVLNPVIGRYLIRSSYGIQGDPYNDCIMGVCCVPCVVNQLYQTTAQRGNPTVSLGRSFNTENFQTQPGQNQEFFKNCMDCCYSAFCMPCVNGTLLNDSIGLPFLVGCCCSSFCQTRNIIRYQYRIRGDDCLEDCVAPFGVVCAAYCCSILIPCSFCIAWPYFIAMTMQLISETESRNRGLGVPPNKYMSESPNAIPPTFAHHSSNNPIVVPVTIINAQPNAPVPASNPNYYENYSSSAVPAVPVPVTATVVQSYEIDSK